MTADSTRTSYSTKITVHTVSWGLRTLLLVSLFLSTIYQGADELTREEWVITLTNEVGASICSVEEFKKCHNVTKEQCLSRVQSILLGCYEEEIENIPATIKDTEVASKSATLLGKCFEPKFADDMRDYRKDNEDCAIDQPSPSQTDSDSEEGNSEQSDTLK